jgi:hypothetical protein
MPSSGSALTAPTLLVCVGRVQLEGIVYHVVADRLTDLSYRLDRLTESDAAALLDTRSRDSH